MANNNDIVSRIRSAPTKEERVRLAFEYAKRDPEGAEALGWENPLLAWQLYNEAQEVGAPIEELGLEGGHSKASAKESMEEGGPDQKRRGALIPDSEDSRTGGGRNVPIESSAAAMASSYAPLTIVDGKPYIAPNTGRGPRTKEEEHEDRTGEWKSPVTGQWYKKNEETGKHEPYNQPSFSTDRGKKNGRSTKPELYPDVAKSISGVEGGLDETNQREIEGMGWDQPILDVAKWQAQDPQGYEKARREAFEEGRSGPRFSDIPKGVWDFSNNAPRNTGLPGESATGGGGPSDPSTQNPLLKPRTPDAPKLRHSMMQPETPEGRGFVNDLGAFVFGDSTLGEENVLGKILTGLFGGQEPKTLDVASTNPPRPGMGRS